jgi:hypothetical protein
MRTARRGAMRLRPFLALVLVLALTLASSGAAYAEDIVINNGLAPPNPANLIDDTSYEDDYVYVENVGCPPGWPDGDPDDPCPSPGDPTGVEIAAGAGVWKVSAYESSAVTVSGGTVWTALTGYDTSTTAITGGFLGVAPSQTVDAYDSSTITMSGGTVKYSLRAYGSSTITMSGGTVNWLLARGSSAVTMSGGTVEDELVADESSTITIVGSGFEVDGVPVLYGDLTALTGTLTGALASGDPIDNVFFQGGGSHTGTITLASPEDIRVPALSLGGKLALAAVLVGSVVIRRPRVL